MAAHKDYKSMTYKYKPVIQMDLKGNILNKFQGISLAAKALGVSHRSISRCAHGQIKTVKGYIWKFAFD